MSGTLRIVGTGQNESEAWADAAKRLKEGETQPMMPDTVGYASSQRESLPLDDPARKVYRPPSENAGSGPGGRLRREHA